MDILLSTLFIVICLLLIIVVLLQKGRGGGIGAAFGGIGSSAFGTRTGDVFTWVTIVLTALFLLLCVAASFVYRTPPSTVFTPTFDPAPGPITGQKIVVLRCATPQAVVHYATDGTEPTQESPSGATVTIGPGVMLQARAYRSGWKPSDVVRGHYPAAESPPAATAPTIATAPASGPASAPTATEPAQ